MRYSSEESMRNFQEAIAMRQQKIENNREEWNRLRNTNMRYLRAGKALITLSTISAGVTIPVILSKMTKDATNYVVHGEGTYTGNMKKIDRRTKSCIITGVVCGIGELAGIFCIARYRNHRDEYDPPFYFTPTLYEESIGFSFMKTFWQDPRRLPGIFLLFQVFHGVETISKRKTDRICITSPFCWCPKNGITLFIYEILTVNH